MSDTTRTQETLTKRAARALNVAGWTCDYGSDEPGNYDDCEDCQRECDKQAEMLAPLFAEARAEGAREALTQAANDFPHSFPLGLTGRAWLRARAGATE